MRVLTIYAHPNPMSFCHAILEHFTKGLVDGGHQSEVVDLHEIGFDPVFRLQDFAMFPQSQIKGATPRDVREQQEKVARAEGLAFIVPVYWMGFPAILKGWIERVFAYDFAYSLSPEGWQGDLGGRIPLLKHKKALIISPTFFNEMHYRNEGWGAALGKTVDEWCFIKPGVQEVKRMMFYALNAADEKTRQQYLETSYQLGKEF